MGSNTHSNQPVERPDGQLAGQPDGQPDGLAALTAAVEALAAQDLDGLSDAVRADRVLGLRWLLDRLEGQWLKELAGVDARGAAGAELNQEVGSTAAWLRSRLRMGSDAARSAVRTARAVFRGALPQTAQALVAGELSPAHAKVVADGTDQLPNHVKLAAEPVVVEAARRLDPPVLRRLVGHLCQVADPDGTRVAAEHRHGRRGLWLAPTFEGMVAVDGLLDPEAGTTLMAALEPLARPADAEDRRSGGQRTADALTELARRALEGGRLPQAGGVRPQLLVTVDLDSLLGRPGAVGGELGGAGLVGPLASEGCRRLACDGAATRVLVTHQHSNHQQGSRCDHGLRGDHDPSAEGRGVGHGPKGGHDDGGHQAPSGHRADGCNADPGLADSDPSEPVELQARLRAAIALLPATLGGAQPTPRPGPHHPGGSPRPTGRAGRPRPRLCVPRL